ncbi:MAG: hypothetical protein E7163_03030 [Firmicutes bacterium]|nr:hypothetical protein [Bacillota bacterium]
MKEKVFVNIAFDEAIKSYIACLNDKDSLKYNSFIVVTIRILALIYGKLDILNPYYLNNNVAFFNNLAKYGMNRADLAVFKEEFLNFYNFEKENDTKKIKIKNPYFKTVLKYLVDMFVAKKRNADVSIVEEEKFLELTYTTHTKNYYQISYRYLNIDDERYIEKYYYSKLNEIEMTREMDLGKTISTPLNLEALNYLGIGLSNLKDMSIGDIEKAQNEVYNYFEVDATSQTRDKDLEENMNYYKMYGKKIATGNGYVDILLLMSVIVTTLSVTAIIICSII